jgi:hypothetical protein
MDIVLSAIPRSYPPHPPKNIHPMSSTMGPSRHVGGSAKVLPIVVTRTPNISMGLRIGSGNFGSGS